MSRIGQLPWSYYNVHPFVVMPNVAISKLVDGSTLFFYCSFEGIPGILSKYYTTTYLQMSKCQSLLLRNLVKIGSYLLDNDYNLGI